MDYTFSSECEFPNNSVGKLILCRDLNEVLLFGNLLVQEELREMPIDEAKKYLKSLLIRRNPGSNRDKMSDLVGSHKDIKCHGKVLGGTQALVKEGLLCIMFDSVQYGQAHPEAIERCVQGSGLILEHEYLDISDYESLEKYLAQ